ncbi:unnamed protein product, partial [Rotaria magnacalcarata]
MLCIFLKIFPISLKPIVAQTISVSAFGYENGTFRPQVTHSIGFRSQPYSVVVGDFNSDNRLDIVTINHGTNSIGILLGLGNGAPDSVNLYSLDTSQPVSAAVADLNNDRGGAFLGDGHGVFATIQTFPIGSGFHPDSIVISDFNKDNILDVVIADSENSNIGILHGSSNSTLTTRETHSTGANSTPIVLVEGDFNNDRRLDLAALNSRTNNLDVFLRYVVKTFANQTTYFTGACAFPISVAVGDFDVDSVLDIAVANRDNK